MTMGNIFTVNMPDIGEGVVEGEVVEWLKNVGDSLAQDEPVVVVMTDKATVELPSPRPGILAKQYYKVGEISILDKPLYDIEVEEMVPEKKEPVKVPLKEIPKATTVVQKREVGEKALATPATRHFAKEHGVNINSISGSGPSGRVTKDDVISVQKRATSTPIIHYEGDKEIPLMGIRGLMAKKMAESKHHAAHFSYFDQCDATRLIQLKENVAKEAANDQIKLTFMPFLIRALSLTLKKFPEINGCIDPVEMKLIVHEQQHIGIAIASNGGLIVPVLKNVETMSIKDVIHAFEELKIKAVANKLTPSDMKGSTITITNFGPLGGKWATPIINYPEIAILGIAKITKEAVVKNDQIVPCPILRFSWSFDHRAIDGALAAKVSNHFISLIENPAQIL